MKDMQKKAGKAFVVFFLMIIGFTILSRIADSFTVPKVDTVTMESTSLQFDFSGEANIISTGSHYISIPEGIRIEQVFSGMGKTVKKGEALIRLSTGDIDKKLKLAKKEEAKLQIQLAQEKLVQQSDTDSASYEIAQEDYEAAKEDYTEAEKDYGILLNKNKEQLLKSKTAELLKQQNSVELQRLEANSAISAAKITVEEGKAELDVLSDVKNGIAAGLEDYMLNVGRDNLAAEEALKEICLWAYDHDIDKYNAHQKEIAEASEKIKRAEESLENIHLQYSQNQTSTSMIAYAGAVRSAENDIQAAKNQLYSLNTKEVKTIGKVYEYTSLTKEGKEEEAAEVLTELYRTIYGETGYKTNLDLVRQKTEQYKRQLAALENTTKQFEIKEKESQQVLEDLEKDCKNLKDGTYDFEEALKGQEELLKAAKKGITSAKRNLDSAGRIYNSQVGNAKDEEKRAGLRQQSIALDLQEKTETRIYLEGLKKDKGIITADKEGIIGDFKLVQGAISTMNDIISISTGQLGVKGTFTKEEGEYLMVGDEFSLKLKGKKERITGKIDSISFSTHETKGEIAEIIGKLENDSFNVLGSSVDLEVTKNSDLYNICIPISALRSDNAGFYILKIREDNGILGKELRTEKVPVELIEKNKVKAAIQGSIASSDKIISGSNKIISEGDRVRMR